MRVIDISRELFHTPVYPGDPEPRREIVRRMELGDSYNLSGFYTGCHSATHVDAPRHFISDGKTVDELPPERFMGRCTVVAASGIVTGADIDRIMPYCESIVLLKGNGKAYLSQSAAFALADAGVTLVGTDAWSIGAPHVEAEPHIELLSADIPILEGLDLSRVSEGNYTLVALPLFLKGAEASPVRAVLLEDDPPEYGF